MRLYLSSYKLGNQTDKLKEMVGKNKKTAFIPNAIDFATDLARKQESINQDIELLKKLGLEVEILDLKSYFGKTEELETKLREFGLVFVRGGNVFILRKAYAQSGFDKILVKALERDQFVYGGYSAGVCVLGPTLKGYELVDDPNIQVEGYQDAIIWQGLGIVDFSFAPHYKSDHPETKLIDKSVAFFQDNKMKYKALKDGELIIVNNYIPNMKTYLEPQNFTEIMGAYSHGLKVDMGTCEMIFVTGQIAMDENGEAVAPDDIKKQTEFIFQNIQTILNEGNSSLDDVVKAVIYVKNINDFKKISAIRNKYFEKSKPVSTLVEISATVKEGCDIEIEVIAVKKKN